MKALQKFAAKLRALSVQTQAVTPKFQAWIYANRAPRYTIGQDKILGRYFVRDEKLSHNRSHVVGYTRTLVEAQIIVEFLEKGRP